jgi:hypothetical protein
MLLQLRSRSLGDAAAPLVDPPTGGATPSPPSSVQDGLNKWRSPGDAFGEVQSLFQSNTAVPPMYLLGLVGVPLVAILLLSRRR